MHLHQIEAQAPLLVLPLIQKWLILIQIIPPAHRSLPSLRHNHSRLSRHVTAAKSYGFQLQKMAEYAIFWPIFGILAPFLAQKFFLIKHASSLFSPLYRSELHAKKLRRTDWRMDATDFRRTQSVSKNVFENMVKNMDSPRFSNVAEISRNRALTVLSNF